ncbi:hypothetical protein Ami103574_10860 [Aminipila butyrica]|uniref:Uncharacterized protein n=1 Tax=Aminipila butyrica TaxID=433296 RepID=A0A858BX87_9FIRM|nr:hypothetical protein [Aminipila butyrica]QIB69789.1 hypothetical protein Ami103574_10860 [Aminipila butyrica]
MEERIGKNFVKQRLAISVILTLVIMLLAQSISFALGDENDAYSGIPTVKLDLSGLDDSGKLIYCGIDVAVFWDPDNDGEFKVVPDDSKVKRIITTHKSIKLDLGDPKTYKKGIKHKLAMRTLYVPIGVKQEPIVIADADNGNDGWVEIPGTLFIPTYFINPVDSPYINHTEKWDENREKYNKVKEHLGQENKIRPAAVFWSGEKFILHVETSEVVSGVAVTILKETNDKKQPYKTVLNKPEKHPTITGAAIYTGELWDESLFNKYGNYIPKTLKFRLDILSAEGEVMEEKFSEVTGDNTDLYYRSKKEY